MTRNIYKAEELNNKMREGMSIWDYIAWIFLAIIAVWLLLKLFGVIKSPLWIEYAPIYGAVYIAGWAMHKLDRATDDIKEVKNDVKIIEKDMLKIREECPALVGKR